MSNKLIGLGLVFGLLGYALGAGWSGSFYFRPDLFRVQSWERNGASFSLLSVSQDPAFSQRHLNIAYTGEIGKPILPYWFFTLVIPQGMKVGDVKAEADGFISLPVANPPFPAQPPVPVSRRNLPEFIRPDPAVYSGTQPWPENLYQVSRVGIKSGFRLVTVSLFPVRFDPANRCYLVASRLRVRISYEPDPSAEPASLTAKQIKLFSSAVRLLVANPEDVSRYAPRERINDFGTYDYCIITNSTLEPYFQRLVNWRTRTGYRGVVRTTSWINSNYTGRDLQEKIRNFIRDYFNNQGTMWVLLGGDNGIVPARRAWAVVGSDTGNIPCDLYYGDLQWSWDSDNDNIFGEYGVDTTDLYYDVYIGRASVDDTNQVKTFVNKVITHETNPPTGYLRRILLVDDSLWSGYAYRQSNESIANITPSGWSDVIIHDPGNTTMVRDSLNNGFQFSHMVGHGNETGIYHTMPPPSYAFYSNSVISGHNNGSKVGLINSIACHPGNFEYSDCLAESTHNWSNGGALAVIMNSRYGWGTPPVLGPSEKLDIRFYDFFFNHDTMPIGLTHAESKEVYQNLANSDSVEGAWRWCYFELNLFGDPLLLMYEQVPAQLNASFPNPINVGSQSFTVTVTSGSNPVASALVCLHKGSEVYTRNYTNTSGQVTFSINPTTPGYMYVTATKPNYLPDIDSCQVVSMHTDVGVLRITAPVGTVDSGATITPSAKVRNYMPFPVANIPVRFTINGGYTDTVTVNYIGSNDSATVEFRDWQAHPSGSLAVKCTTMLANDTNPANDYAAGTVFVRYRDVGTVSLTIPATIDSGTIVTPLATVRNYGNTNETFNIRLVITGTSYDQTRAKTLAAGAQDTVNFPSWTALERGTHTARCSTRLAGDNNSANDRATADVFVQVRDVGTIRIISPTGNLDSTTTLPVQAKVKNFGNTTESFYVHFRILGSTSWQDSTLVNSLGPGDSAAVNFSDWPCGPRGNYSSACSTALPTDMRPANDRITGSFNILVHDIAAREILAPGAQVDSGAQVEVRVAIVNQGSVSESARVFVRIGSYYQDSTIVPIPAGAIDTVPLSPWQVSAPRGPLTVFCSTAVHNDVDLSNDTLSRITEVVVHDVAAIAILAPADTVDSGSVATPQARLKNLGSVPDSFNCRFTISDGYISQIALILAPGIESVVSFPNWYAQQTGSFTTRCTTLLAQDRNPINNRALGSVVVTGTDVGVAAIVAPVGEVDPGAITPIARVGNYSISPKSFRTYLWITPDSGGLPVFSDSVLVESLPRDSTIDVSFSVWDATSGRFVVRCSTGLVDGNPVNDTLSAICVVVTHDVAVVSVLPHGEMRPMAVAPVVKVKNVGEATETGQVYLVIVDSTNGNQVYSESAMVTGVNPGESRDLRLPVWTATSGYFRLTAYAVIPGDINPTNDTMSTGLRVWSQGAGWQRRQDVPGSLRRVKYGGALTAVATGSGRIYALKGNKTLEFYEYDPVAGDWRELPSMPGPPSGRPVYKSGALCSDNERYIYATKGNNTLEFWRYDIQNQTWEQRADIPAGIRSLKKGGTGLAYVRRGDSSFVYCLKGSNTLEFYAYSVEQDAWQARTLAPAEASGRKFKAGSALCSYGSDRLFAIKSYTNEFYEYSIPEDRWINRSSVPLYSVSGRRSKCKDGCAITSHQEGILYLLTGGNRDFFFAYSIETDNWFELEPMPVGETGRHVKAGAALACLNNNIYALRGNATNEFYVYITDTTTLISTPPARSGVAGSRTNLPMPVRLLMTPNPAQQKVKFVYQGQVPAQLKFYSAAGRLITSMTIVPGEEYHLNTEHLPAGVYLARVSSGSERLTQKLLIQH